MNNSEITFRASASNPCPVCGSCSKNCSATADGLHFCRGDADLSQWFKLGQDDTFQHYRRVEERHQNQHEESKTEKAKTDIPQKNWRPDAELWAKNFGENPDAVQRLAEKLNLPCEAFAAMQLIGVRNCWPDGFEYTLPESDHAGTIIGIGTRVERDSQCEKKCIKNSKRGLILPEGWCSKPGPLLIVEGPSDTLAMSHAGLCCIGRPSNTSSKFLPELLAEWPDERPIILLGENDRKDNGDWPGRDGAYLVAGKLARELDRTIQVSLPPEPFKDARLWLTDQQHWQARPWSERGAEVLATIQANLVDVPPENALTTANATRALHLPKIIVGTDEHRVNDEATLALGSEPDIYQRGGLLVQVFPEPELPSEEGQVIRRPAGLPTIREVNSALLRERLSHCAFWVSIRNTKEGPVESPTHPPTWSVAAVQARGKWPSIWRLDAVVTFPVMLHNGQILLESGYFPQAGLLVCTPPDLTLVVPERPNKNDVAAAVAVLLDPIQDFPFETDAHRSAFLAGLLTPLAWFLFDGPSPLFLIDKNIRGAGAGLLADVIALTLTGRRFPVMTYTSDRDELRKAITSLAIEGERMVLLDNLSGAVGNDVLDAALTSDTWKNHVLGTNTTFNGPLHVCWYATGNNVQLHADTSRRICHIRMESPEERPETKTGFKYSNLRDHVKNNRAKLLSAALTLLRAWIVNGRPKHNLTPWGSFEGWSDVVREVIVFAGLPDPGQTRIALQDAADRDAAAMNSILDGLERLDDCGRGLTTKSIVEQVEAAHPDDDWLTELGSAIEELCGKLDGKLLGVKFRHFRRRTFEGGRFLDSPTGGKHAKRWRVYRHNAATEAKNAPNTPPDDFSDVGHERHSGHVSSQPNFNGRLFANPQGLPD